VVSFTAAAVAVARLVQLTTGSRTAALASAALYILNPNLLYLQATPMTEPLLVAFVALGRHLLCASSETTRHREGAGLSRVLAACLLDEIRGVACDSCRDRRSRLEALAKERRASAAADMRSNWRSCRLSRNAVFVVFSVVVVGEWFVSGGFFRSGATFARPSPGRRRGYVVGRAGVDRHRGHGRRHGGIVLW
jgi:hypothetical protein